MLTTISIKGARFRAYHGYYEEERLAGHDFTINTDITLKPEIDIQNDINNTVNYELVYTLIKTEMENTQFLLETVLENILKNYKSSFKNMKSASIEIEKHGPQLGGNVDKTSIKMQI